MHAVHYSKDECRKGTFFCGKDPQRFPHILVVLRKPHTLRMKNLDTLIYQIQKQQPVDALKLEEINARHSRRVHTPGAHAFAPLL